jgi:hypothetical protein
MFMKAVFYILAILFTMAAPAAAQVATPAPPPTSTAPQTPMVELYGGGTISFMRPGLDLDRTILPGAQVALNVSPFASSDSWLSRMGFAVEVNGARYDVTLDDALVPSTKVRLTQASVLGGPTFVTMRRGRLTSQLRPLFGVARMRTTFPADLDQPGIAPGQPPSSIGVFEDEDSIAASIGSAWDIRITRAVAVRINQGSMITRFGGKTQMSMRMSTGIAFRWYGSDTRR